MISVFRTGLNTFLATWDSEDTSGHTTAVLQRSEHVSTGYEDIVDAMGITQFVDTPTTRKSGFRTWHYRIFVDGSITVGPARVSGNADPFSMEAARLANRHLERDIRTQGILFAAPTKGVRCPECWNDITGRRTRSACSTCGGSGFVQGYADPETLYVSFGIEKEHPQQTPATPMVIHQIPMWTGNQIIVTIGDYVIRGGDLRLYEITRWQPTIKSGFLIRQNMVGRLVEKNDLRQSLLARMP